MIVPKEMRTHCPWCNTHTIHKVKIATSKYRAGRTLAIGTRRHERKMRGLHGKVKGKAIIKKTGIRQKILLTCPRCGRSRERVVTQRTKKRLELAK